MFKLDYVGQVKSPSNFVLQYLSDRIELDKSIGFVIELQVPVKQYKLNGENAQMLSVPLQNLHIIKSEDTQEWNTDGQCQCNKCTGVQ